MRKNYKAWQGHDGFDGFIRESPSFADTAASRTML